MSTIICIVFALFTACTYITKEPGYTQG